jgi:hypothetical protein
MEGEVSMQLVRGRPPNPSLSSTAEAQKFVTQQQQAVLTNPFQHGQNLTQASTSTEGGSRYLKQFISNHHKVEIFQVSSFRMTYFEDPWILPSPSATMDETGHPGMSMPLSSTEVAYSLVQQASANPDLTPAQELDPLLEPIWAQGSLANVDSLDLVLPSDE